MILVYRPELESPPMAKECTLGFSFIAPQGLPEHIQLNAGVNRDFPSDAWEQIKKYDVVKRLLSLNALRVETEDTEVVASAATSEDLDADTLDSFDLPKAMGLIEDSFDIGQLRRWDATDKRIRVKSAIAKRITAITEGKG